MEENKIKLSDLLGTCLEYTRDPKPEHKKAVDELFGKMVVRSYLPMKQKEILLITILNSCITNKELDAVTTEINLTAAKTIYGVLSYVVNLENDLDFAAFDAGAIDMLYEMGIIDGILKFCQVDFARLEKMLDETMNFANLNRLAELASLMTPDNIDTFTKAVLDMKTELTPERLQDLKSLANSGSPEWQALKETVVDEVLGRVMDKDFAEIKQGMKQRKVIKKKVTTSKETKAEVEEKTDDKPVETPEEEKPQA